MFPGEGGHHHRVPLPVLPAHPGVHFGVEGPAVPEPDQVGRRVALADAYEDEGLAEAVGADRAHDLDTLVVQDDRLPRLLDHAQLGQLDQGWRIPDIRFNAEVSS